MVETNTKATAYLVTALRQSGYVGKFAAKANVLELTQTAEWSELQRKVPKAGTKNTTFFKTGFKRLITTTYVSLYQGIQSTPLQKVVTSMTCWSQHRGAVPQSATNTYLCVEKCFHHLCCGHLCTSFRSTTARQLMMQPVWEDGGTQIQTKICSSLSDAARWTAKEMRLEWDPQEVSVDWCFQCCVWNSFECPQPTGTWAPPAICFCTATLWMSEISTSGYINSRWKWKLQLKWYWINKIGPN